MFNAVFIALVILVAAILITRHVYLGKIEKLKLAHQDNNNLEFRRGFDGGWESCMNYRDQKASYDKIMNPEKLSK